MRWFLPPFSVSLPYVDKLLENTLDCSLFPCLMESRVYGEHPVFGDGKFFPARLHNLKILSILPNVKGRITFGVGACSAAIA
jgi:hypothetical protein